MLLASGRGYDVKGGFFLATTSFKMCKIWKSFCAWLSAGFVLLQKDDVRFCHVLLIFQSQSDNYGAVVMKGGLLS